MKTTLHNLPAYWATALINNDESGLDQQEIDLITVFLNKENPGSAVDVSEDTFYGHFNGLGTELATYTFIK